VNTREKHPNFPFVEIAHACEEHVRLGRTIYQKFTCEHCGARQTMGVPNALYTRGKCEECNGITDILHNGCNYVLIYSLTDGEN